MPLYDYKCKAGHITEQRGGFDTKVIACPERLIDCHTFEGGDSYPAICTECGGEGIVCGKPAMRQATYPGQRIIIK